MKPDISRVHIIGTSHIAKESVKQIEQFMDSNEVNLVCVELDRDRLYALKNNVQGRIKITDFSVIKRIGLTGFIFALIAQHVQKKMGDKVKVKAGSDMMAAVNCASQRKIPIALIDQDVNLTLQNLSKKVPFGEKLKVIYDIFKGLIGFKSDLVGMEVSNIDLSKVPPEEFVDKILHKTKHKYPHIFNVLVEDRNKYMVDRIKRILKMHQDWVILVVIGAGHKEGMVKLLEHELVKNKEKQDESNLENANSSINYSYSHSVKYK